MTNVDFETIMKISGYDVTFIKITRAGDFWINAYVRLENLKPNKTYAGESYRDGDIIGVDTMRRTGTITEKTQLAINRIGEVIEVYLNNNLNDNQEE